MVVLLGLAASLPGQHTMGHTPPKAAAPGNAGAGKNKRTPVDKWNRMSPEERQKLLSKLPPDRRKKFEDQLNQYQNMTPEQRQDMRSRLQMFNQLPPEKQTQARRVWGQYGKLPADRQPLLRNEFENLRSMPEAERNARVNSDEFRSKYNAGEQNILRDFSGLLGSKQ
jgi:predicted Fe-S protein YdhL (DUF1289 family)